MNQFAMLGEILVAVLMFRQDDGNYDVYANNIHMNTPFMNYNAHQAKELIKRFVPEPCRDSIKIMNDEHNFVTNRFVKTALVKT